MTLLRVKLGMLLVGKRAVQCLYRPSQMAMSFDIEGALARSFFLTSPAHGLFLSPPPFRPTDDEDAVSAVLDTSGIWRNDNNGKS